MATLYPSAITNASDNIAIEANHTIPFIFINGIISSTNLSNPQLLGKSLKNTFSNTAIDPTIVIGIIAMNESLIATRNL